MKLMLVNTFEEKGSTSPLGLISIATYLREKAGFNNTQIADVAVEDALQKIEGYKPDAVGISAYTYKYNSAVSLAKNIRKLLDIPVFIGGPHITLAPQSLNKVFDFAVIGEGEQTMIEVLHFLQGEKKLGDIYGLGYYKNGKFKFTPHRPLIEPLDDIPIPDREFASKDYFLPLKTFWGRQAIEGNILTSRGCPYRCPFCATSTFWKKVRFHSVDRVADEIQYLSEKYHVDCINIWDDFFTVSKKRVRKIAKRLKEGGLIENIEYRVQVRVNTFDEEMAQLLQKMNVTNINCGFESGSQKILKQIKKDVTVEQIKNTVIRGSKYGMAVTGSLMFGIPNETLEDMKLTLKLLDWMYENGAVCIWFFVATPYPNTEFWNHAYLQGTVSNDMDWDLLDLKKYNNPLLLDSSVNLKEFRKVIEVAERKTSAYFKIHDKSRSLIRGALKKSLKSPKMVLGIIYEMLASRLRQ